jgi:Histidine kinase
MSRRTEVPGPVYTVFDLPGVLVGPGEHVVAMRLSTYWFNRPDSTMNLFAGNVELGKMAHSALSDMLMPLMGVGALAFFGIAAVVLWVTTGRPRGVLLFAGLNLGGSITLFLIHVRHLFPVPYSWSYPVWTATEVLVALTAACIVLLVLIQFDLPRRRWIGGAFVAAEAVAGVQQAIAYHTIGPIKFMILCWWGAFVASILLLAWALARRRRGAVYVLASACLALFWYRQDTEMFLSRTFFPTMLPLILSFVLVIGLDLSAERRQAREARLTAARLELELLRKSLQPHFLMNTLTVLSQAMEENPGMAGRLIEDLAAEMRELAQFAEKREIPLGQELELCRTHLRVMSVRTEKPWTLEAEGIDPEARVPPALFFNLIENGFTHQQPVEGATAFRLRTEALPEGARYVFFSPGGVKTSPERAAGGSGLRYVKARLEEGWPGRWSFDHGPVEGGWETRIELRRGTPRTNP